MSRNGSPGLTYQGLLEKQVCHAINTLLMEGRPSTDENIYHFINTKRQPLAAQHCREAVADQFYDFTNSNNEKLLFHHHQHLIFQSWNAGGGGGRNALSPATFPNSYSHSAAALLSGSEETISMKTIAACLRLLLVSGNIYNIG